ncbi:uncharacterized protein BO66DRAFT_447586 [Aspergillus aculeatinus CBS 121060]|uniref:Uncharacterized protein n=1 Tax=Aspergillus aculeatinus CBS 121060 TaxID=1448322 RepID=A0ACD1HDK7_9EURO|nr:hypothetical protein BO66DRAFT_447586 [Aspergillus aculeatinus CBS 121060]RAH71902.1 hypothetical protein BO66DRAFT_447586 [Aspergillus aculeatinus CBS 121060]
MPSIIKALTLHALLTGAFMSQAALASPLFGFNPRDTIVDEGFTGEDSTFDIFDKRGKTSPKLATADFPSKSHACPKTDKYTETTYTSGQLTKAYVEAVKYANEGKQIGKNKYPHGYANHDKLPFECGSSKMEFVLDREDPARVFNGGDVTALPDRVIFEYTGSGKTAKARFCGVIRHAGKGLADCPAT